MRVNSLAFRLFASAAAWTVVVLPIAGLLIHSLYRSDAEQTFNDRLATLLTVIQADSIDHAGIEPKAPGDVGEPLFEIKHSGWYWQIRPLGTAPGRLLASASLAGAELGSAQEGPAIAPRSTVHWVDARGPNDQPIRIAQTILTVGEDLAGPTYAYSVAGPLDWLEARLSAFATRLTIALAMAGLALLGVTLLQVRYGLAPLRNIERGLAAIRSGDAKDLGADLPAEIEPLQIELNALLASNEEIVERARTQVGNLAHALKTPLAVITNEASDDASPFARKVAAQATVMKDQIGHYLDRARMAARAGTIGRVTEVKPVVESLVRALTRIYAEKGIAIAAECPAAARFQGEKQDLEEMLGNLLDNACKWASSRVSLVVEIAEPTSRGGRSRLVIEIDDDGPGLSDEARAKLGKRGVRLDETKPGSGLGLSIVVDLAQSYRGSFRLDGSPMGGLGARLELPAV